MKYFVFRNTTVESLFQSYKVSFSGYEDIAHIERDADRYVWFYMHSLKSDVTIVSSEIRHYIELFKFTLSNMSSGKMILAFTMHELFDVKTITSSNELSSAITHYNNSLYEISKLNSNVKVINFSSFLAKYSIEEIIDWKYYFISQMIINPRLSNSFNEWFLLQLDTVELKRKKCLILDLDNTLWGGILGEDGLEGIKLGGDYPGKAYKFFQQHIDEIRKQGVILCVCSKNNYNDILEVWDKHPEMVLKQDHFTALKINWNNKAENIKELASELNIGLDSMVFVDDNPSERELVKLMLPEVAVPDYPDQPYNLLRFFKYIAEKYFSIYSLTKEDVLKTEQYKQNILRESAKNSFVNIDDYVKNLEITLTVSGSSNITLPRISQLTQKTNQFNLTTRRYTDTDIITLQDNGCKVFALTVSDKFGDYGLTGVCLVRISEFNAEIDTFLLSCRVLGKKIEEAFLGYILNELKQLGVKYVNSKYIPSSKNNQVSNFYDKMGFNVVAENEGVKDYELDTKKFDFNFNLPYIINRHE